MHSFKDLMDMSDGFHGTWTGHNKGKITNSLVHTKACCFKNIFYIKR